MFSLKHGFLSLFLFSVFASGCAGPATPFGGVWSTSLHENKHGLPQKLDPEMFKLKKSKVEVKFEKEQLSTDQRSTFKFFIKPKDNYSIKSNYKILIRYNDIDITTSFFRTAKIEYSPENITVESAPVFLSSKEKHKIEVVFGSTQNEWDTIAFIKTTPLADTPERKIAGEDK